MSIDELRDVKVCISKSLLVYVMGVRNVLKNYGVPSFNAEQAADEIVAISYLTSEMDVNEQTALVDACVDGYTVQHK